MESEEFAMDRVDVLKVPTSANKDAHDRSPSFE